MTPVRVAVIGVGSFGRNHLRVYRELQATNPASITLAAFVEPNPELRRQIADRDSIPGFASVEDLLHADLRLDAVSVCVPTVHHAAVAEQLLQAGLDVLIEKPFAVGLPQADNVLSLAASLGRIVAIGHLERFNPAVTATLGQLKRPMFFEAHRLSIFTPRSLDVDVVLDLMIHDLDIVLAMAQSPVHEVRAVGLPILSRKVDIANVRVEFASGCVANFTASRVSTEQVRKLRLFQASQYLSLDFARQELLSIEVDPAVVAQMQMAAKAKTPASQPQTLSTIRSEEPSTSAAQAHPTPGMNLRKFDLPHAEPLRLELEDFLHAVTTRSQPRVNGTAGRAALELALEINQQIQRHAHRAGLI